MFKIQKRNAPDPTQKSNAFFSQKFNNTYSYYLLTTFQIP